VALNPRHLGYDGLRAQRRQTYRDVHHHRRGHAIDELGHAHGCRVLFFSRRWCEIIVRPHDRAQYDHPDLLTLRFLVFVLYRAYSAGAGSDHMSWHRAGFPAIFATEGDPFRAFNPYIHTADDRIDLKDGEFSFEVRHFTHESGWHDRANHIMYVTKARARVCKGGCWICGRVGGMGGLESCSGMVRSLGVNVSLYHFYIGHPASSVGQWMHPGPIGSGPDMKEYHTILTSAALGWTNTVTKENDHHGGALVPLEHGR